MKQSPKYVNKWDKDKRNRNSYFHANDGNYIQENEDMENFDLHKWVREEAGYRGI